MLFADENIQYEVKKRKTIMKVLFITGSLGGGGAERVIANLVDGLEVQGVKTWIAPVLSSNKSYKINNCTKFYDVKISNIPIIKRVISVFEIRKAINSINPDVVISFLDQVNILVSLSFCTMSKKPKLIFSERNDPAFEPHSKIERLLRNVLYRRADGIVFQTTNEMMYFDGKLKKQTKRIVIENPIKTGLPIYNENTESKNFIAAGRLNHQKNYKMMIDSFSDVVRKGYDCTLTIYGVGELKDFLLEYIHYIGMEQTVTIMPFTSEIHDIMANAYCFLLSSDYEGISNSMLEALAIGIPVISTDYPSGGAKMYIENGINGYLVPCGNKQAFTNAIISLIDNREAILLNKEKNLHIKNDLSVENITEKWISFIQNVI